MSDWANSPPVASVVGRWVAASARLSLVLALALVVVVMRWTSGMLGDSAGTGLGQGHFHTVTRLMKRQAVTQRFVFPRIPAH